MKVRNDDCDKLELVEALNTYFTSILTIEDINYISNPQEKKYKRDVLISVKRVETLLSSLKQQNSQGPDDIHPAILKVLSSKLSFPLTIVFRKSFRNFEVPEK